MLPEGCSVLVGVSGGADSVALLAVLRELTAAGRRMRISVAHLDHGLRPEGRSDAAFVRGLARQWDLPVVLERRDVLAEARARAEGIEQAARRVRYAFLTAQAERLGADRVAVGHNADDNVETILYRIVRGTHLRGLSGMPPVRRLRGSKALLIRPLLSAWRDQIESYCRQANLKWCEDATNRDVRYRRNFIRHELFPLLRERLNVRAPEALLRLSRAAGEVEQFLDRLSRGALDRAREPGGPPDEIILRAASLAQEPGVVRSYALRGALEEIGAPMRSIGAERLEEFGAMVVSGEPAAVDVGGGVRLRRDGDRVLISRVGKRPGSTAVGPIALALPGRTELPDGRQIECRRVPFDRRSFADHRDRPRPGREWLDADQLRGPLICRTRRDGDVFWPLGAPGRQNVGDFLTNAKLPPARRERVRCICDELGIVYLAPLRIDQRVRITERTRDVLQITVEAPEKSEE